MEMGVHTGRRMGWGIWCWGTTKRMVDTATARVRSSTERWDGLSQHGHRAGHSYAGNGAFLGGFNNTAGTRCGHVGRSINCFGDVVQRAGRLGQFGQGLIHHWEDTPTQPRRPVVRVGRAAEPQWRHSNLILGGQYMQVFERYETASGQFNIND